MPFETNIMVGGEAGQGIQTVSNILSKALTRVGLWVFQDQDYESRIRGGHNFFRIRAKDSSVQTHSESIDILAAFNRETYDLHKDEVKPGGVIILDSKIELKNDDSRLFAVPLEQLAEDAGEKIMINSVAVGVVMGLLDFDFALLTEIIRSHFTKSLSDIQYSNIKAARAGHDFALQNKPSGLAVGNILHSKNNRMFINGSHSVALGAISAGCKFLAAYPMTPITPILEYIASKGKDYNIAVFQPEDEIAAINMVIGASYAGARAMTVTSGSGYALMVEGIGLSGIAEIPAVIVLGERPGPAVGLPTRTEQGELLFPVFSGTGEFPRVILAPAGVEDAFYLTAKAFNMAEKFQIPVIVIIDTYLGNSYAAVEKFDLSRIKIERGEIVSGQKDTRISGYNRYALTDSGISPRAFPGQTGILVCSDSDEHDETGHITESAEVRTLQVSKRLKKYELIRKEISVPEFIMSVDANYTLIGWGSTRAAIKEAAALLANEKIPVNILHFTEIWPFPAEAVSSALNGSSINIAVENNALGQMAYLIRAETGIEIKHRINKWDGRPLSAQFIVDEFKKLVRQVEKK